MIKFIYSDHFHDKNKEIVTHQVYKISSSLFSLPAYIEIEFKKLDMVYGELLLNPRFKARIRIDERLSLQELVVPLLHELLHLNQMQEGRLKYARQGVYWDNKLYHVDLSNNAEIWKSHPWEIDVAEKLPKFLEKLLGSS